MNDEHKEKAVSWQISCADMALRCMVSAVKPEHRRRHRSASRNAAKVSV